MTARVTMTAAQLADLAKVGPHGWSHGWVHDGAPGQVFTSAHEFRCPDGHKGTALVPDGSGMRPQCVTCRRPMTPKGGALPGSWAMESCCTPSGPGGRWAGPPRDAAKCTKCFGTHEHAVCTRCKAIGCDGRHDDCGECDGSGHVTCPHCEGEGVTFGDDGDEDTPCPSCDGGDVPCPVCHGTGLPPGKSVKAAEAADGLVTMTAAGLADVLKVGPHGYIHGWIKVGPGDEGNTAVRRHLDAAADALESGDHAATERHHDLARRAAKDPATRAAIDDERGQIAADRLTRAWTAKERKALARSMSDAELKAADKELSRRAVLLGYPGQVSSMQKAVRDEVARRKGTRGRPART